MNKNEIKVFLVERGISGFVPTLFMRQAFMVSDVTIRRWVHSGMLLQRERDCYAADDVLDFIWKNPHVIAKVKAKLQKNSIAAIND